MREKEGERVGGFAWAQEMALCARWYYANTHHCWREQTLTAQVKLFHSASLERWSLGAVHRTHTLLFGKRSQ